MNQKLYSIATFFVACLILAGPGCSSSEKKEGVHPDPSRFPPSTEVDYILDISGKNKSTLPHFFHPDSLNSISVIGDSSNLDDEYYDTPRQIDIDGRDNIYIVQKNSNTIRVYNKSGQFKYSIGKSGRGPGEFGRIISFSFDKNYLKLYVLDMFEIEIFVLKNGRYEYETTVHHKLIRPHDLCLLGNSLFLSGYKISDEYLEAHENEEIHRGKATISPPIHKFDLKSIQYLKSFGYKYPSYSGWGSYDGRLSATMLSCNEFTSTVVGYLKHYPYIFGYDTTGRRKWVSQMQGYKSTRSEEIKTSEGPAFYLHMNENIYHYKYPIQKIYNEEYSLLQFIYAPLIDYFATSKAKKPYFKTILVNTKTGELSHSDAYPYIGVWKGRSTITMDIDSANFQKTFQINELQ